MPYVTQEIRAHLDKVVEAMREANITAEGDLNYVLFKYFVENVRQSYQSIKNYRAELRECADEIGRRYLAAYEDKKIGVNGDV